jgi:hypothetical protein
VDVKKVIKTKKGEVTFKGTLSPEEHEYVLAVGLNTLMEAGALPMQVIEDEDDYMNFPPQEDDEEQVH